MSEKKRKRERARARETEGGRREERDTKVQGKIGGESDRARKAQRGARERDSEIARWRESKRDRVNE